MGWERKRGKLHEFNRLLRGATDTSFTVQHGRIDAAAVGPLRDHARLRHAAADRCGARALVGTLSHPLNRPRFDPRVRPRHRRLRRAAAARRRQRRERQPHRVRARVLRARRASIRTRPRCRTCIRICFTKAATSARASTTSTRSRRALADRVPENALLSHDLFEGRLRARRRCAPTSTSSTTTRRTTWRSRRASTAGCAATGRSRAGCGGSVPTAHGRAVRNTLPVIARWKILDNLRRSLIAVRAGAAARLRLDGPARARRGSGRCWRSWSWPSRPTHSWCDRSPAASPACEFREHLRAEADTILTSAAPGGVLRWSSSRIRRS